MIINYSFFYIGFVSYEVFLAFVEFLGPVMNELAKLLGLEKGDSSKTL